MLCERISGNLSSADTMQKTIEYVEIEWHEVFKRIHSKVTNSGRSIGIRMGHEILTRGLHEGDVIHEDEQLVIAVRISPCDVINIEIEPWQNFIAAKVCYEIGNRHAPLFFGKDSQSFITPYNEPMFLMLQKVAGIHIKREIQKLDFSRRVSAAVHNHQH